MTMAGSFVQNFVDTFTWTLHWSTTRSVTQLKGVIWMVMVSNLRFWYIYTVYKKILYSWWYFLNRYKYSMLQVIASIITLVLWIRRRYGSVWWNEMAGVLLTWSVSLQITEHVISSARITSFSSHHLDRVKTNVYSPSLPYAQWLTINWTNNSNMFHINLIYNGIYISKGKLSE